MSLWRASELQQVTGGVLQGDWDVEGISIDSRDISKGDLFVALKAARDGHDFVEGAFKKGANAALVSRLPEGCDAKTPLLIVENVEDSLEKIGRARRSEVNARIVAVTGSAGKTSTKEMLRHVFENFGKTHASVKSFNNHWGVPLTLARMPRDTEFGIFEIGMNAPGEIAPLVKQVAPDVAIITNIAPVHLAGFENEHGIAVEKASIMQGLLPDGLAIVFRDMSHFEYVESVAPARLKSFGRNPYADYVLRDEVEAKDGALGNVQVGSNLLEVALPEKGFHHLLNAASVCVLADEWGCDLDEVIRALSAHKAPAGRGEVISLKDVTIVDESYNANPLSMKVAVESFARTDAVRKVAILGDMLELGERSSEFHLALADIEGMDAIDVIHTIGDNMKVLHENLAENKGQHFSDFEELKDRIEHIVRSGDAVLLKGSFSMRLGEIVQLLRNKYSLTGS